MKNYKDYEKKHIGDSDIACLILAGFKTDYDANKDDDYILCKPLHFGEDGTYDAYVVDADTEIPVHYEKRAEFQSWIKVYDDNGLVKRFDGGRITVYRSGSFGCIIQIAN